MNQTDAAGSVSPERSFPATQLLALKIRVARQGHWETAKGAMGRSRTILIAQFACAIR